VVVLASVAAYAGLGFVTAPSKAAGLAQLPSEMLPHGAAINSTFVQIANAVGSALFVGILSSDVLHDTAAGLSKSAAYAAGFADTMMIAIGIAVAAGALAFFYARALHKKR
jgi:MFS transporter, DHA2 family, lincomycin resistance protein